MCTNKHDYGGVQATRTVKTDGGTYHVCRGCASDMKTGGWVHGDVRPLASENPRQRCQCEHEDHKSPNPPEQPCNCSACLNGDGH